MNNRSTAIRARLARFKGMSPRDARIDRNQPSKRAKRARADLRHQAHPVNRRGNTHRGGWPRAWRLILAHLHDDQHAHQLIHTELGDCPGCWRDVALAATEFAALSIYGEAGGSTTRASAYIEGQIACALDAEALDKIDAPITPDTIAEAIRRQAETRRTAAAPRPVTNQDVRQHRRRER